MSLSSWPALASPPGPLVCSDHVSSSSVCDFPAHPPLLSPRTPAAAGCGCQGLCSQAACGEAGPVANASLAPLVTAKTLLRARDGQAQRNSPGALCHKGEGTGKTLQLSASVLGGGGTRSHHLSLSVLRVGTLPPALSFFKWVGIRPLCPEERRRDAQSEMKKVFSRLFTWVQPCDKCFFLLEGPPTDRSRTMMLGARWRLRGDVSEPCRAHSACPGASLQLQAWPTTNYNGIDEARGVPVFT